MKLADKKTMLISFINTMLSDKNDDYYLLQPELSGSVKIDVGNGKSKKYQFINGDICVPYSVLKEEHRDNYKVISGSSLSIYTYIKKDFINENTEKQIKESEDNVNKFFEKILR